MCLVFVIDISSRRRADCECVNQLLLTDIYHHEAHLHSSIIRLLQCRQPCVGRVLGSRVHPQLFVCARVYADGVCVVEDDEASSGL